jgi:hypothetical protein
LGNLYNKIYYENHQVSKRLIDDLNKINGTLEHLFEDIKIMEDFSSWKNDPVLSKAYQEAEQWNKQ